MNFGSRLEAAPTVNDTPALTAAVRIVTIGQAYEMFAGET